MEFGYDQVLSAKVRPFSIFMATDGVNKLEIDTKPWGESDPIINKNKRAHVKNEKAEEGVFQALKKWQRISNAKPVKLQLASR